MAANANICSCLLSKMAIFKPISLLVLLSLTYGVNCSTTQPSTTVTAGTTTTTSTQAPTTTTTQVQTTTTLAPTTTTIAPNQPRTEIEETVLGQCLCDVTGNNCDVNCCCDTDCSQADIDVFDCNPISVTIDDKLCYQEDVFIFSNSPETTRTEGDLFCIVYDNYKERNFYLDPDFILDFPTFNQYLDKYSTPSLQRVEQIPEPVYTLNSFYRAGDPIYVVYPNESTGKMVLPLASTSSFCNDQNPMAFLRDVSQSCARDVTLSQQTCENTPAFIAASYYTGFRVVKTVGLFGYIENGTFIEITTQGPPTTAPPTTVAPTTVITTNGTTVTATVTTTVPPTTTTPTTTTQTTTTLVNVSAIQDLYDNPYTLDIGLASQHLCQQVDGTLVNCGFTTIPAPTYTALTGECANIVLQARYTVVTEGTAGINSMQVQFVFANVTQPNLPITQTYSTSFDSALDNPNVTQIDKSGNPGYLVGKPLLYGTLNSTTDVDGVTTQFIERATTPTLGLSVVRATSTGECSATTSTRIPLRFGENMRTGCLVRLTLSSISQQICRDIQEAIINALEGPNTPTYDGLLDIWIDNNRYVGTFGNTADSKVGDWVKVIASDRPILDNVVAVGTPADTCRLSMGMHIQVLYSSVGALALPQSKIIGVAILYDAVQNIKYRCTGAFCQDGTTGLDQVFEVSQTVSFVDVSQPAVKYAGEAPIFIARVPNDFFYPFLYYTSSAAHHSVYAMTFTLSALVTLMNLRLGF